MPCVVELYSTSNEPDVCQGLPIVEYDILGLVSSTSTCTELVEDMKRERENVVRERRLLPEVMCHIQHSYLYISDLCLILSRMCNVP